jgi:Fe-S cluster assembly protein SufD
MTKTSDNPLRAMVEAIPARPEPEWLTGVRKDAAESLSELGFPTIRHEEWRWTNLKPLLAHTYVPAAPAELSEDDIRAHLIEGADEIRLVFVNGRFSKALSRLPELEDGLLVAPMANMLDDEEGLSSKLARYADHHAEPFVALNTALFTDGAYIRAGRDAVLNQPVHVLHVSSADDHTPLVAPRLLVQAGEHASLQVIESFVGLGESPRFIDSVAEVALAPGAKVRHAKILHEADNAFHIGWNEVRVDRDAEYHHDNINLQAALSRTNLNVMLTGEGAHADLKGLVLGRGSAHFDNHLLMEHVRPHCTSNQLYRSVVDDKSRSVFSGKIVVRPGALGTDAQQQNNNLLLSDDARVDTKPQLEIYADDVKCSHGATSGQLDQDAVFFMRTRGMDEQQARDVLTYAFANDVIEQVAIEAAQEHLQQAVRQRFQGLLGL